MFRLVAMLMQDSPNILDVQLWVGANSDQTASSMDVGFSRNEVYRYTLNLFMLIQHVLMKNMKTQFGVIAVFFDKPTSWWFSKLTKRSKKWHSCCAAIHMLIPVGPPPFATKLCTPTSQTTLRVLFSFSFETLLCSNMVKVCKCSFPHDCAPPRHPLVSCSIEIPCNTFFNIFMGDVNIEFTSCTMSFTMVQGGAPPAINGL